MTALEQARAHFEAGDFAKARAAAMDALAASPDDPELLRLAGRAGVETGADDAVAQLSRVAEMQSDSAEAWHDLGDALLADGRDAEAANAFRRAVDLNPDNDAALTNLGHTEYAAGGEEAVAHLEQAAERGGGMSTAAISLVDMYRSLGQHDEALAAARRVVDADPDNALFALDVAELSLVTGSPDDAYEAFARVRELVDLPEDEVGALHGMVKAELAREREEEALELARQAGSIDTVGRSAGVLAHLEASSGSVSTPEEAVARGRSTVFLQAIQAPPSRQEAEILIDATLADLRRSLSGGDRG